MFNDTTGSGDASAVQLDYESSYKAEDTSFVGFDGEVHHLRMIALQRECFFHEPRVLHGATLTQMYIRFGVHVEKVSQP